MKSKYFLYIEFISAIGKVSLKVFLLWKNVAIIHKDEKQIVI